MTLKGEYMTGYGRKIRRKIENCRYTDEVADLLARRIRQMPEYKDCKVESMGPFGLGATCSVHVDRDGELVGFLTIGYNGEDAGNFNYVDYNAPKIKAYPEGSIGDMNGFNYQKQKLPTDINEAVGLVFDSVGKEKEDVQKV
jgi:hypothetical protein